MSVSVLPPGYRFHPTDIELVCCYLKRKIMERSFHSEDISDIDLNKFSPWDLPELSRRNGKDLLWYFFCVGEKKYTNGSRKNRATEAGYWKTTGKDKPIMHNCRTVALRKTLVFHERKPQLTRTDWVMHEYRLADSELADAGINQDAYVLCKIFEKSGRGPKIGEQYGPPFMENEWEDGGTSDSLLIHQPLEEHIIGQGEPNESINNSQISYQITPDGSQDPDLLCDYELSSPIFLLSQEPDQLNYFGTLPQVPNQIPPDGSLFCGSEEPNQLNNFDIFCQVSDQTPLDESQSHIDQGLINMDGHENLSAYGSFAGDFLELSDLGDLRGINDPTVNF